MATDSLPKNMGSGTKAFDWRPILPIVVIISMYAAGMAAVMPVLPFYVREMGGSALILGVVVATEALSQFCSAPVLGQLSDRFGRKQVLLASQIVAAMSLLLLVSAPTIVFILIARALFGMAAGNLSVALAYVADHSDPKNRRQAIGILAGGGGLGGIVGAGLSGFLSDSSLTAPIYAALVLTLLSIAFTFLRLKDQPRTSRSEKPVQGEPILFRAVLGLPVIRIVLIVMLCHFFAYGLYISQMPVFLADTFIWNGHAFGPKELSYIMIADGVINVLVQLFLLGWLSKYFTERNLVVLIFILVCTGFLTASLATTIPVLGFAIICVSISDALAKPTFLAALSVHVPPRRQGVVMGSAQALVSMTEIAAPLLGGFILGYELYGVWIGVALVVALTGTTVTIACLPNGSRDSIVRPEATQG